MTEPESTEPQPSKEVTGGKSVEFSAAMSETKEPRNSGYGRRRSSRGSFLNRMGMSFRRSGGDRGATVETLRGQHGADFEGYALVHRGETGGCGCFGGKNLEKLILIKGPFCFVFEHEKDLAPKYAISLAHLKAKKQEQSHSLGPGLTTLETSLGDVEYEINFQGEEEAKTFVTTANKQAAKGESQEVRKRLGHEHLLNKRSSIRFAEQVALKKVQDQPEKAENITGEDLVQINMAAGF